jgi:hypothetical protein
VFLLKLVKFMTLTRFILVLGGVLVLVACASSIRDVSNDPNFVGRYSKDKEFVVVGPLFVDLLPWSENVHSVFPAEEASCTGPFHPNYKKFINGKRIPLSLSQYREDPTQYTGLKGVLKPGTRIRFIRGTYLNSPSWNRTFLFGEVVDGDMTGTSLDLTAVSKQEERLKYTVNQCYLRSSLP